MLISDLRERITLYHNAKVVATNGDYTLTPTAYLTCWASVKEGMGSEQFAIYGKEVAQGQTSFLIRFNDDVLSTDSIVWRGVTYAISSFAHTPDRNWTQIAGVSR